jgi:hypothetical protein
MQEVRDMSSSYTGRAMSPVADQMDLIKPHVVRAVAVSPKRHTDQHTFILAKPPEWMAQGRCVGNLMLYDESVGLKTGEAAARCAGCPVIEQCLTSALAEEGNLSAGSRYGIRGGLSPKERAALTVAARECERGHMNRWADDGNVCLECKAEDVRKRYEVQRLDPEFMARKAARLRKAESVRRVSCVECKTEMRARHLDRHLATVHEERVA